MNKIYLLFLVLIFSCYDSREDIEDLKKELEIQRQLIDNLNNGKQILGVENIDNGYRIKFSDDSYIDINNGSAPVISIGNNGNWFIDGTDTNVSASGSDGFSPNIEIGSNDNWYINGLDSGIPARGRDGVDGTNGVDGINGTNGADGVNGRDGVDAPKIISIIQTSTNFIFNFSDGSEITIDIFREDDTFNVILPKNLFFAKDKEIKLFYNNFVFKSHEYPVTTRFNFNNLGIHFQDYFNLTPTKTLENRIGSINVYDNLTLKTTNFFNYNFIEKKTASTSRKILFLGDSFTDIGTYVTFLRTKFNDEGLDLNLLGTMGNSNKWHEAHSGGNLNNTFLINRGKAYVLNVKGIKKIPTTGFPGTSYKDSNNNVWIFRGIHIDNNGDGRIKISPDPSNKDANLPLQGNLTRTETLFNNVKYPGEDIINYNGIDEVYLNPFWNPKTNSLDFKYYINYWNFENPDIIVLKFGWNDLQQWSPVTDIKETTSQAKQIIDRIHEDFPNTKIIYSIQGSGQVNNTRNSDTNGRLYTVLNFSKELINQFEKNDNYSSFVNLAPTYAWIDPYLGYRDGIHPNDLGFEQIANCLYPLILKVFNE